MPHIGKVDWFGVLLSINLILYNAFIGWRCLACGTVAPADLTGQCYRHVLHFVADKFRFTNNIHHHVLKKPLPFCRLGSRLQIDPVIWGRPLNNLKNPGCWKYSDGLKVIFSAEEMTFHYPFRKSGAYRNVIDASGKTYILDRLNFCGTLKDIDRNFWLSSRGSLTVKTTARVIAT